MLNLVEAILASKFPQLTTQEVLAMLDIKTADLRQTRFFQEILEEGRQEGRQEGIQEGRQEGLQEGRQEGFQEGRREAKAMLLLRFLTYRLGSLSEEQGVLVQALSLEQLDALSEVLFELADVAALDSWLQACARGDDPA